MKEEQSNKESVKDWNEAFNIAKDENVWQTLKDSHKPWCFDFFRILPLEEICSSSDIFSRFLLSWKVQNPVKIDKTINEGNNSAGIYLDLIHLQLIPIIKYEDFICITKFLQIIRGLPHHSASHPHAKSFNNLRKKTWIMKNWLNMYRCKVSSVLSLTIFALIGKAYLRKDGVIIPFIFNFPPK